MVHTVFCVERVRLLFHALDTYFFTPLCGATGKKRDNKKRMQKEAQIKSRQRVIDHGEVFTDLREVNAMLDLVKHETERVDARFLEPACGTGNFLVEILRRKLSIVRQKYAKNQIAYECNALIAVGSIYGIDIQQDNLATCRERLFELFDHAYTTLYKNDCKTTYKEVIRYILSQNIIWGDALTLTTPSEDPQPITFVEWVAVHQQMIQRREYSLAHLLHTQPISSPNLFSDLGERAFIPTPIAHYPLTHYLHLHHQPTDL